MGDNNPGRSSSSAADEEAETSPTTSSSFSTSPLATMANSDFRTTSSAGGRGSALPTATPSSPGCGCVVSPVTDPEITVSITPTTGGQFDLTVDRNETIENLKKIISKRLKVAKERICLLHRERQLREGTLDENRLQDGSRLTLLPSVETGLLAQRPEQSVMQALESLSDSQVNDFLSGKAPLNLTMRLGDHMMLIQLQLSTVTPASPVIRSTSPTSTGTTSVSGNSLNSTSSASTGTMTNHVSTPLSNRRSTVLSARSTSSSTKLQNTTARTSSLISNLTSASCNTSLFTATTTTNPVCPERETPSPTTSSASCSPACTSPSSISSSSSSSPISTHPQSSPIQQPRSSPISPPPSGANATNNTSPRQSCLLHHLHHHHTHHTHHHHHHTHHHHHHHHHHTRKSNSSLNARTPNSSSSVELFPSTSTVPEHSSSTLKDEGCDTTPAKKKLCTGLHHHHQQQQQTASGNSSVSSRSPTNEEHCLTSGTESSVGIVEGTSATLDTRALAEASRNLTQKLKQLSSEVFTSRVDLAEENARRRQGAIIQSMHHHGKGVYSGTFSGTLNPALQDRHGRPKRDISTIIHILNDLLCATPATTAGHYRHHHRHSSTRQISSTSALSASSSAAGNGMSAAACLESSNPGYSSELSKENETTKGKLRRLRQVMEQRRAKRAKRKARAAPYTTQWAAVTPDPNTPDPNTPATSPNSSGSAAADSQTENDLKPCNTVVA